MTLGDPDPIGVRDAVLGIWGEGEIPVPKFGGNEGEIGPKLSVEGRPVPMGVSPDPENSLNVSGLKTLGDLMALLEYAEAGGLMTCKSQNLFI